MEMSNTANGRDQVEGSHHLHVKDYLSIIRKRKHAVIIFSVLLISAAALISLLSPRTYQATAQLIIEKGSYPISEKRGPQERGVRAEETYLTQLNLLQSRSLAVKVVEDLQLWREFQISPLRTVHMSSDDVALHHAKNGLHLQGAQRIPENLDKAAIIDWYLGNLRVEPVPNTALFNVSFLSRSPEMAALIANTHARAYITENLETRRATSQRALEWLQNQLAVQRNSLEASQRLSHEYKRVSEVLSFDDRRNIVSQQLEELNASLTKMKAERLAKQTVFDQLNAFTLNSENVYSLPEVARDPVIQNLRTQLIQQKTKRMEMTANYGPKHPKMIDIESGIGQTEEELTTEIQRLSRSIKAEMDRALVNERSLQNMLDSQKAAAMQLHEKAINYEVLSQEVQSNQQLYDTLLKQAKELGLASVFDNSAIRIVEEAEVPKTPISPKVFWNIFLAIMVSMIMGPSLAFFSEYMDNTVRTPEDIQRRIGIPLLGTIPRYARRGKGSNALIFGEQIQDKGQMMWGKSRYAVDPFDIVIQHLEIRLKNTASGSFFFQSAVPGEGKTTILANTGRRLSQAGFHVLMVDADYLQPSLHAFFAVNNAHGLTDGIERVLSMDIIRGSLTEFSIDDLFTLVSLKKLSGKLEVVHDNQVSEVLFDRGFFVHMRSQPDLSEDRLGAILIKRSLISDKQLREVAEIHRNTGEPLEDILLREGSVTPEELHEPYKMFIEKQIEALFRGKHGEFHFHPGDVERDEPARICYAHDYVPLIQNLGRMTENPAFDRALSPSIISIGDSLSLLPAGTASARVGGALFGSVLSKCLHILQRRFDVLLVDTAPILGMPPMSISAASPNDTIFVVKAGNLHAKSISDAIAALKRDNADMLGVVLNHFRE